MNCIESTLKLHSTRTLASYLWNKRLAIIQYLNMLIQFNQVEFHMLNGYGHWLLFINSILLNHILVLSTENLKQFNLICTIQTYLINYVPIVKWPYETHACTSLPCPMPSPFCLCTVDAVWRPGRTGRISPRTWPSDTGNLCCSRPIWIVPSGRFPCDEVGVPCEPLMKNCVFSQSLVVL